MHTRECVFTAWTVFCKFQRSKAPIEPHRGSLTPVGSLNCLHLYLEKKKDAPMFLTFNLLMVHAFFIEGEDGAF